MLFVTDGCILYLFELAVLWDVNCDRPWEEIFCTDWSVVGC